VPASAAVTLSSQGTYYWQASYAGDTNNLASTSTCGAEVETVTPAITSTATSLSGGSQSGSSISVPGGTAVTDTATLSGTNASTATGTVTYNVYSDSACTVLVNSGTPETITTPGSVPASAAVTLSSQGTYYWQASYAGDTNNLASTSTCGAEVETVTAPTTALPTKLKTLLLGSGIFGGGRCWWSGDEITVYAGTAVTDSASLSGPNASEATGTVTYTVYSLTRGSHWGSTGWGWNAVASGGTFTVTGGLVPNSNPVTLPPGTYQWQASYSGDPSNQPSTSRFGSETENVVPVPTCHYGWKWGRDGGCKPKCHVQNAKTKKKAKSTAKTKVTKR
jgi:hypothetical protein